MVALPLAAGAFAWAGFVLAPAAAGLMSASTVIVAINAQFLRRHRGIAAMAWPSCDIEDPACPGAMVTPGEDYPP